ncbi:Tetratricopeptide TPR_2 repeat-containing protein [Gracilinema caldarium DSM 7334]|uniref:Tetratricopeptide TPR_2 repeat-containing protein n=2 Tax=Gracilinema caldarium TaxID=215591 RepID=F8EY33_GRAC1|nr:Tetratricopeptide TPR_2 repeat-containing protein [Gracilinema caldarium DSM 7334]
MLRKRSQHGKRWLVITVIFGIFTSCATSVPRASLEPEKGPTVTASIPTAKAPEEKNPTEKAPVDKTEQILTSMQTLMQRGDFSKALELFNGLPIDLIATADMQRMKATILAAGGNLPEARTTLQNLLSTDGEKEETLFLLAHVEGLAGNIKEQKQILEKIVSINPKNTQALTTLGDVAYAAKTYKLAEAYYKKVLSIDPNHSEALIGKGKVDRYNKNPKSAEEAFNKVISMNPDWALPLQERARLYRENNFLREALADLDKAKELAPRDYWIALDRGNVLLDLGKKEEALKEYERAISIDGDYFLAYVYSAGIKDELEDYKGAEQAYKRLSELNPDYYFAFEALGVLYMRDKRWAQAKDAFIEAYKRSPNHSTYALLAAIAWYRSGKAQNVKGFLEKVIPLVEPNSLDWYMLRLYYDFSGDTDIATRIGNEKKLDVKARMLYYLAQYYDLKGNINLANKYFMLVRDMNRRNMIEWRLNQWEIEARGLPNLSS